MRVRKGAARRQAKKRLFKDVKGNYAGRGNHLKHATETRIRGRAFSYRDRRLKKRDYRALWIVRVTAACRMRDISYSQFIHGLTVANVGLNRKSLSELAIHNPEVFDALVQIARDAVKTVAA